MRTGIADHLGMRIKHYQLIACLLVTVLAPAWAEDAAKPLDHPDAKPDVTGSGSYASAMAGLALDTSSGSGSQLIVGGRIGTGVFRDHSAILSLGAGVETVGSTAAAGAVTAEGRTTVLFGEMISRRAWDTGIYLGIRAGLALSSATVTTSKGSFSSTGGSAFAWAPLIGYEIPVNDHVSIPIDISWITVLQRKLEFSGLGEVPIATSQSVLFQAGVGGLW